MIKLIRQIHLKPNAQDLEIIRHELFLTNLQRWKIYFWLAIPVSLIHIIVFTANLDPSKLVEYNWRKEIIMMHGALILLAMLFGGSAFIVSKKRKVANRIDLIKEPVFYILLLLAGAGLTGIDQQVTSSITPFIIVCIIASLLLLVHPFLVSLNAVIAYLFFFFLQVKTQPNPEILLSNQVNGVSAVVLTIGLSAILWKAGMTRHRQSRMIESQKADLARSYEKLQEYARELQMANDTKDRFFSIMAHDLFGPIAGISSYLEVLMEEATSEQTDLHPKVSTIQRLKDSADNTVKLIENLLTWARTQRKDIVFDPKPVDLIILLRESADSVRAQSEKKNIRIEIIAKTKSLMVSGDANMLETVFRNLISNAIKFSYRGSQILLTAEADQTKVIIGFTDHGVGISTENKAKLFQIGEKITSRGTDHEPGTGLGLILCHEFVNHHHGRIIVRSEPGKGSTFEVELPLLVPQRIYEGES